MAIDNLEDLQDKILSVMRGNDLQMIGTSVGNLSGVLPHDPIIGRSPCAQLKWLEDNTPFNWEAYVVLSYDKGHQGLRVTRKSDDSLVINLKFPITGGDDGDPMKQIPINHRRMMRKVIRLIATKLEMI